MSDDETDNPLLADDRNFYKVEKWTTDGVKIDRLLYAGNNLKKAQEVFVKAIKHRSCRSCGRKKPADGKA